MHPFDASKTNPRVWFPMTEEQADYCLDVLLPGYFRGGFYVTEPLRDAGPEDIGSGQVFLAIVKVGPKFYCRELTVEAMEQEAGELRDGHGTIVHTLDTTAANAFQNDPTCCPLCGNDGAEYPLDWGSFESEGADVWQGLDCSACGSRLVVVYTFSALERRHRPDKRAEPWPPPLAGELVAACRLALDALGAYPDGGARDALAAVIAKVDR